MQQVVIAARKRDDKAIISALQAAGVLHIVPVQVQEQGRLSTGPLQGAEADERKHTERLLARAETTLTELGTHRVPHGALPDERDWGTHLENVAGPASILAKRRAELTSDLDAAGTYGQVTQALATLAGGVDRSRRLAVIPFTMQVGDAGLNDLNAALNADLKDRYALDTRTVGNNVVGLVVVPLADRDRARAALGKARVGELRLPGRFDRLTLADAAREFERIERETPAALRDLDNERARLADTHAPTLYAIRDALADRVAIHDVQAVSARGKYSMVLQGYVPADRVKDMQAALATFGNGVSYQLSDADEHHGESVPVQLKNNSYVRPFQVVMGLMSLPKYGTFDPTWVIAVFFPLFFGIIMADIGYGLLFLAFGMWLLGKAKRNEGWDLSFFGAYVPPETLRNLGFVTNVMAAWTILWGLLTGEFFGTLLEHAGLFYVNPEIVNSLWGWTGIRAEAAAEAHHGVIPILFPRLETSYFSNVALVFSLLFGIVQVLWGWGIRIAQGLRHRDPVHTWEGLALFGGVGALIAMAFATRAGKDFSQFTNFGNPLVLLMYVGFLLFIVGWIRVIKHFPMLPIELLSQGGAVMSYSRIFAVGLVSAILAKLCTDLGWSLGESLGILGVLIGIILGVLLHFFVLALTLIGHIVQPLRLHMVEFLNPTGFNAETSPAYNPLRRLSPVSGQGK
ncbi:V-type ATP synthase subunit I [Deinococcus maricopensis]|uniref:V-type ATPase 116 kDa subunit n=1 Tax=Deinococcus maricopensis (strain DSM 21211 / LMG 22137 / NRRL B-23946 / LB-34) TaxID=709986 RepID=E8UBF2_DEIML|nr:V-type ATPase 116 kDa subunit [Deinococcus maricopensis DSM 21211]